MAWTRQQYERGDQAEISTYTEERIVSTIPQFTVQEKMDLLLRHIASKSKFPGDAVKVASHIDWPIVWGENDQEFSYLLGQIEARKLVLGSDGNGGRIVVIQPEGWKQLEQKEGEWVSQDQVFVAMNFAKSMDNVWNDGIKPAILGAGYQPHRVDSEPHIQRIDMKIIGDIRASRFVVADVTGQRVGVYFEAGYALALGRPVIWCVQEDELNDIHFDTRQFNHIAWKDSSDLKSKLEDVIAGVIGRRRAPS